VETKPILYLGNKLKSKGFNPTTIDTLSDALKEEGFSVLAYSSKRNKLLRLLDMLWAIIRHRHKAAYALIDTYSTSAFWFAYISARLLKHYKIDYIPLLHGGNLPLRFKKNKKHVRWLLDNAKVNVSPSYYLFEFFQSNGFKNLIKIPNFISIENYTYRRRSNPKPHLLWVRAFENTYNPFLAVQVLELVLEFYPDANLTMVGPAKDGSYDRCKSYIEEKQLPVYITGQLPKEEWIARAQDLDVFLNTTTVDNTPVSVIEAMAMGMLVVSTNVGGLKYLLKNENNAMLVNPNAKKEMAKAVRHLLENPELSQQLSQNARFTAEKFSWEEVKLKWFDVLR